MTDFAKIVIAVITWELLKALSAYLKAKEQATRERHCRNWSASSPAAVDGDRPNWRICEDENCVTEFDGSDGSVFCSACEPRCETTDIGIVGKEIFGRGLITELADGKYIASFAGEELFGFYETTAAARKATAIAEAGGRDLLSELWLDQHDFTPLTESELPDVADLCSHGAIAADCNDCMIASDFAFDAARESR